MQEHTPGNGWDAVPPTQYAAAAQRPAYGAVPPYPPYGALPLDGPGYPVPGLQGGWPPEPDRPGMATAASVLGFVTGGLTLLMELIFLIQLAIGGGDGPTGILLFGIPVAAGLIAGAVRLLGGHSSALLFGSGLVAIGVLALSWLVALGTLPREGVFAVTVFVVMALPLPVVTAAFAWTSTVRRWTAGED